MEDELEACPHLRIRVSSAEAQTACTVHLTAEKNELTDFCFEGEKKSKKKKSKPSFPATFKDEKVENIVKGNSY